MMALGNGTKKVTVSGLERYAIIGADTVALECDEDGCKADFGDHKVTGDAVRQSARNYGWETSERGDFCPKHASSAS
jgi:hypothetical protein